MHATSGPRYCRRRSPQFLAEAMGVRTTASWMNCDHSKRSLSFTFWKMSERYVGISDQGFEHSRPATGRLSPSNSMRNVWPTWSNASATQVFLAGQTCSHINMSSIQHKRPRLRVASVCMCHVGGGCIENVR